jgi:hypothetical protein
MIIFFSIALVASIASRTKMEVVFSFLQEKVRQSKMRKCEGKKKREFISQTI